MHKHTAKTQMNPIRLKLCAKVKRIPVGVKSAENLYHTSEEHLTAYRLPQLCGRFASRRFDRTGDWPMSRQTNKYIQWDTIGRGT